MKREQLAHELHALTNVAFDAGYWFRRIMDTEGKAQDDAREAFGAHCEERDQIVIRLLDVLMPAQEGEPR